MVVVVHGGGGGGGGGGVVPNGPVFNRMETDFLADA